jgi:hypothetical protein
VLTIPALGGTKIVSLRSACSCRKRKQTDQNEMKKVDIKRRNERKR